MFAVNDEPAAQPPAATGARFIIAGAQGRRQGPEDASLTSSHARVGYRITGVSSWGCLALRASVDRRDRLITSHEGSPSWPCLRPWAPAVDDVVSVPSECGVVDAGDYGVCNCTWRAMAQMKPIISRAIAVVTTTLGLPLATRRRYRPQRRTCAFHGVSRRRCGRSSIRSCSLRLTLACMR